MSTELATTPSKKELGPVIATLNNPESLAKIQDILPGGLTIQEVQRTALMAVHANPKLAECTPASVLLSVMRAAQFGVVVDGRHAHLIPYKRSFQTNGKWNSVLEAQFQWDYKGIIQKVRQSPDIRDIYAEKICAGDRYRVLRGTNPILEHEIPLSGDRGAIIAFYSVVTYKDGTTAFDIMTVDEVEAIRKRSKSYDPKTNTNSGSWATDYAEMGRKTVVKRHSKYLPLPSEVLGAINADTDYEELPEKQAQATVIKSADIPQTSLPERTEPPAPEKEAPAKPKDEKPAATEKASKKLAPAPEKTPDPEQNPQDSEPPAENFLAVQCEQKLKEAGCTPADLIRCAQANDWLDKKHDPEKTPLSVLSDEDLTNFMSEENWDTVLTEIKRINKK